MEVLVAASIVVVAAEAAAARAGHRGRHVPIAVALGLAALAALAAATGGPALALLGFAGLAACYLAWVGRSSGRTVRIAITALFGLVHGFAFAGPLADLALPAPALARALLGFNLGIELAQLALLGLGWLVLARARRAAPVATALALDVAAGLAIAPAIYWAITRAA
ncbi:MAG: HupE/UreJ family protein [Myxococcales bacterium]|nr:HupE/UreJ family protein [Myxococcales bacterium]